MTLNANHYADDFIAEHNSLMRVKLYIQKVGSPGVDFTGRVALSKHGDPTGDYEDFRIREEEVSTSAGWHTLPIDVDTVIGARYFIKVPRNF